MERTPADARAPKGPQEPVGPLAAIIIVVILLAIGGVYFFLTQESKLNSAPAPESPLPTDEAAAS